MPEEYGKKIDRLSFKNEILPFELYCRNLYRNSNFYHFGF